MVSAGLCCYVASDTLGFLGMGYDKCQDKVGEKE